MARDELFRGCFGAIVVFYAAILLLCRWYEPKLPSWRLLLSFVPTLTCMALAISVSPQLEHRVGFFAIGLIVMMIAPVFVIQKHHRDKRRLQREALRRLRGDDHGEGQQ